MTTFSIGDEVVVIGKPAGKKFHGKIGTIVRISVSGNYEGYHVKLDNDPRGANGDGTRCWSAEAYRKATKLDKVLK